MLRIGSPIELIHMQVRRRDLLKLRRRIGLSARERDRILSHELDRCRIVVGDAARLSDLRSRMRSQSSSESGRDLVTFVDRQARLALDRRERSVTGPRYKVPQDVKDQMVGGRRFEDGIAALAEQLGRPSIDVRTEALGYLACEAADDRQGDARRPIPPSRLRIHRDTRPPRSIPANKGCGRSSCRG